jgi:hypothetical protein
LGSGQVLPVGSSVENKQSTIEMATFMEAAALDADTRFPVTVACGGGPGVQTSALKPATVSSSGPGARRETMPDEESQPGFRVIPPAAGLAD